MVSLYRLLGDLVWNAPAVCCPVISDQVERFRASVVDEDFDNVERNSFAHLDYEVISTLRRSAEHRRRENRSSSATPVRAHGAGENVLSDRRIGAVPG